LTVNKTDKAALERAMALKLASKDKGEVEQIESMLKDRTRTWREVAEFASYSAQIDALKLMPWQNPPCVCDPDRDEPGDRLLRRMLKAGVSQFHPDPVAALAEAEAMSRATERGKKGVNADALCT
jgi:hypothetical protein